MIGWLKIDFDRVRWNLKVEKGGSSSRPFGPHQEARGLHFGSSTSVSAATILNFISVVE